MSSAPLVDGLVLAATALDDRGAARALRGLAPAVARMLAARLAELEGLSRERRHKIVRALARDLAMVPPEADVPARARAILLTDAPPGERASDHPLVRRGFRVSRSLKWTLRRLVASRSEAAASEERAAAERVDALGSERASLLRAWTAEEVDPVRALGALVLGVEGASGGDASTRRLRAVGRELALVWSAPWAG